MDGIWETPADTPCERVRRIEKKCTCWQRNKKKENKKVLLRERKRHTARRVVSTPCCPTWVPPWGGNRSGTPPVPPRGGTQSGTPLGGTRSGTPPGTPPGVPSQVPPRPGTPPGGYPVRYPPGGVPGRVPPDRVPPSGGSGVPSQVPPGGGGTRSGTPRPGTPLGGYPARYPRGGVYPVRYPPLPHGILGNVAKHYGIWVPPPVDRQTPVKTVPSRRTTYAGGKKEVKCKVIVVEVSVNYNTHRTVLSLSLCLHRSPNKLLHFSFTKIPLPPLRNSITLWVQLLHQT